MLGSGRVLPALRVKGVCKHRKPRKPRKPHPGLAPPHGTKDTTRGTAEMFYVFAINRKTGNTAFFGPYETEADAGAAANAGRRRGGNVGWLAQPLHAPAEGGDPHGAFVVCVGDPHGASFMQISGYRVRVDGGRLGATIDGAILNFCCGSRLEAKKQDRRQPRPRHHAHARNRRSDRKVVVAPEEPEEASVGMTRRSRPSTLQKSSPALPSASQKILTGRTMEHFPSATLNLPSNYSIQSRLYGLSASDIPVRPHS